MKTTEKAMKYVLNWALAKHEMISNSKSYSYIIINYLLFDFLNWFGVNAIVQLLILWLV